MQPARGGFSDHHLCTLSARSDKRLDLHTLAGVLGALRRLTGQKVSLTDLLTEIEDSEPSPVVRAMLTAPPVDWESLIDDSDSGMNGSDEQDEAFWDTYRVSQDDLEKSRRG